MPIPYQEFGGSKSTVDILSLSLNDICSAQQFHYLSYFSWSPTAIVAKQERAEQPLRGTKSSWRNSSVKLHNKITNRPLSTMRSRSPTDDPSVRELQDHVHSNSTRQYSVILLTMSRNKSFHFPHTNSRALSLFVEPVPNLVGWVLAIGPPLSLAC